MIRREGDQRLRSAAIGLPVAIELFVGESHVEVLKRIDVND